MNEFSKALFAYHAGDLTAEFVIHRNDGYQSRIPARRFFETSQFSPLETKALELCSGRILDVGAAAGRHSLALLQRGADVTALDILPEMELILRDRGVTHIVIANILNFNQSRFETLIMLMHGIGMVGTVTNLKKFLQHAHQIVTDRGQILCDSVDVSVNTDPIEIAYRNHNSKRKIPIGRQTLAIEYNGIIGKPFRWLNIDFESLAKIASKEGWHAEQIMREENGHFLYRLKKL